jgi:nitroreductase
MAVMTLLLAAEDRGLGALFFGVFQREADIRAEFGVPEALQLIGAIALGRPRTERGERSTDEQTVSPTGSGRSAGRRRRSPNEIIHRNRW